MDDKQHHYTGFEQNSFWDSLHPVAKWIVGTAVVLYFAGGFIAGTIGLWRMG